MQKTKTKMTNKLALTELTILTDPKQKTMGKIYKAFTGKTDAEITEFIKYYCGKYGILQAITISKEEYEQAVANNK